MRGITVVLIVCLTAIVAAAQVSAPVAPVFYGFRNSVIDHNGRVVVFDGSYVYPPVLAVDALPVRFPPTVTTRVTVVESDAVGKRDAQYDGTFQVVGVGRYAVYAILTSYPAATVSSQFPAVVTRQLVAIGPSFPTLPSVDLPLQNDVKVSAVGDDGAPDTIVFIDNIVALPLGVATAIVEPLPATPPQRRTVQMYRSDGNSFKALPPVVLSTP
jgi:hypothetical protein